jgi:hypothetical protein
LVSGLDIESTPGPGFDYAAVFENSERVEDGFNAEPVIATKGANRGQTVSGTEDIRLNLNFERVRQCKIGRCLVGLLHRLRRRERRTVNAERYQIKLFWSIFLRSVSVLVRKPVRFSSGEIIVELLARYFPPSN